MIRKKDKPVVNFDKNRKIILVSLFYYEKSDNIRISTLYRLLKEKGADIELITTDFNHRKKRKHVPEQHPVDITFLPVPEYKKNIGFRRLYSHLVFAIRLWFYLKKSSPSPSVVYCLVPAVTAGLACSRYCRKNNLPFIVDVIDLWPESFLVLSSHKKLLRLLSYPWKIIAEKVYRSADYLFAGSAEYARHAQKFNRKTKAVPVYLGTDVAGYKKLLSSATATINKPPQQKWICFGGMLGNSYDIDIILKSFKKLTEKRLGDLKLVFVGDGPERDNILQFKSKHGLDIEITGFLSYADYMKYVSYADIAINSFKKGTKVAYSYKFNDYLTAGVPVLNNVKGEMAEMITRYDIGRNFDHSVNSMTQQLSELISKTDLLQQMRKNANFVATAVLDKQIVYREMLKILMQ